MIKKMKKLTTLVLALAMSFSFITGYAVPVMAAGDPGTGCSHENAYADYTCLVDSNGLRRFSDDGDEEGFDINKLEKCVATMFCPDCSENFELTTNDIIITVEPAETCGQYGQTVYKANFNDPRVNDWISEFPILDKEPVYHNFENGVCTRCGAAQIVDCIIKWSRDKNYFASIDNGYCSGFHCDMTAIYADGTTKNLENVYLMPIDKSELFPQACYVPSTCTENGKVTILAQGNDPIYDGYKEDPVFGPCPYATKTFTLPATGHCFVDDDGEVCDKCIYCGEPNPALNPDKPVTPTTKPAAAAQTDIKDTAITLSKNAYTYTGKALKPAVTIKQGAKLLKNGTDYTVSYKNNTKVGTASVTVTGKGSYKGTKALTFKINPKGTIIKKLTATKKGFSVKIKKQAAQTTGYQIRYSTKASMGSAKTVTIKSNKTLTKKIAKLKAGKKYYVQIRTFKTVGKTKYYSAWSAKKSVKTKK